MLLKIKGLLSDLSGIEAESWSESRTISSLPDLDTSKSEISASELEQSWNKTMII